MLNFAVNSSETTRSRLKFVNEKYYMAITKKGSRSIVVENIKYRWRIRQEPTRADCERYWNFKEGGMTVAVENAETAGCVLLIHLPQPHPGIGKYLTAVPITPSQVAEYIKEALKEGWKATDAGSAFRFFPKNKA